MRLGTYLVFDDVITGNGPVYTSADCNGLLAQGERFALHAEATGVVGEPTLDVLSQQSADDDTWGLVTNPETGYDLNEPISDGTCVTAEHDHLVGPKFRYRLQLEGENVQARIKLYVTVRGSGRGAMRAPGNTGRRPRDTFEVIAFDDIIEGDGSIWFTPASLNGRLASADRLYVQATTTYVSDEETTLLVHVEHSANGQDWVHYSAQNEISTLVWNGGTYQLQTESDEAVLLGYARLKIQLQGTAPRCRLTVRVTGRGAGEPESRTAAMAQGNRLTRSRAEGPEVESKSCPESTCACSSCKGPASACGCKSCGKDGSARPSSEKRHPSRLTQPQQIRTGLGTLLDAALQLSAPEIQVGQTRMAGPQRAVDVAAARVPARPSRQRAAASPAIRAGLAGFETVTRMGSFIRSGRAGLNRLAEGVTGAHATALASVRSRPEIYTAFGGVPPEAFGSILHPAFRQPAALSSGTPLHTSSTFPHLTSANTVGFDPTRIALPSNLDAGGAARAIKRGFDPNTNLQGRRQAVGVAVDPNRVAVAGSGLDAFRTRRREQAYSSNRFPRPQASLGTWRPAPYIDRGLLYQLVGFARELFTASPDAVILHALNARGRTSDGPIVPDPDVDLFRAIVAVARRNRTESQDRVLELALSEPLHLEPLLLDLIIEFVRSDAYRDAPYDVIWSVTWSSRRRLGEPWPPTPPDWELFTLIVDLASGSWNSPAEVLEQAHQIIGTQPRTWPRHIEPSLTSSSSLRLLSRMRVCAKSAMPRGTRYENKRQTRSGLRIRSRAKISCARLFGLPGRSVDLHAWY